MKIIASDGSEGFKTVEECQAYENELARREAEQRKEKECFEKERGMRLEEIREKDKELKDLIYKYEVEYGVRLAVIDDFSSLFGDMCRSFF